MFLYFKSWGNPNPTLDFFFFFFFWSPNFVNHSSSHSLNIFFCLCFQLPFPVWVSLRVHPWGPEVSHRLPDTLPPPWGPGTQSGRGPQYPCCFLVYWRSHYSSGGQHQSGGPAEKLLLWQEDDYNTSRIVTASDPGFITFFIRTLACVLRVCTNISAELKLDHIKLPGSTIWHVILVQHWHSSKLYAKEVWVKRLYVLRNFFWGGKRGETWRKACM